MRRKIKSLTIIIPNTSDSSDPRIGEQTIAEKEKKTKKG